MGEEVKQYKKIIMLNASIRGPFVPHWSKECWSDAYLDRVTDEVKVDRPQRLCIETKVSFAC